MFRQVHHMGIVVDDLERAKAVLGKAWGLSVNRDRTPGDEGVIDATMNARMLEFPLGQAFVRVFKPLDDQSPMGKFLKEKPGGGGFHVSLITDTPEYDVSRLLNEGIKFWLPPDKKDWDGKSPVYLDPSTTGGVIVQVWPDDGYVVSPQYRGEGVFSKLHHCGLAARTAEEAVEFWVNSVGCSVDSRRAPLPNGRRTGRDFDPTIPASDPVQLFDFPVGQTEIEISVPLDGRSGTGRFVERFAASQPFAIHHICPYAGDVERACARLNESGMQQIGSLPERRPGNPRVGWYHPRSILGVLMEIWHDVPFDV